MRRRSVPFWISGFIHVAVIGAMAALFIQPPEFIVEHGENSVEVNLVAAAPDPVPIPPLPPVPVPQEPAVPTPPKPDDLIVPVAPPVPPPPPVPVPLPKQAPVVTPPAPTPPKPSPRPTLAKGDGRAPKPGKDATTASSKDGAITDVKPDYLNNPQPVYPESARLDQQEGIVVLEVEVNTEGLPDDISIQTSSGFSLLDQSAINAVRKWRFRPASIGGIKVKSRVTIPVRFQLEN